MTPFIDLFKEVRSFFTTPWTSKKRKREDKLDDLKEEDLDRRPDHRQRHSGSQLEPSLSQEPQPLGATVLAAATKAVIAQPGQQLQGNRPTQQDQQQQHGRNAGGLAKYVSSEAQQRFQPANPAAQAPVGTSSDWSFGVNGQLAAQKDVLGHHAKPASGVNGFGAPATTVKDLFREFDSTVPPAATVAMAPKLPPWQQQQQQRATFGYAGVGQNAGAGFAPRRTGLIQRPLSVRKPATRHLLLAQQLGWVPSKGLLADMTDIQRTSRY
jgi:hypothetical protein